jgi:cell division protein FtsZ
LGGGTGGGAAPVVAQAAKAAGALVLGVVAMPFDMEGSRRQRQALLGLARLRQEADVVIPLPNQRIISLAATQLTVPQLFAGANEQLAAAVRAVWRMVTLPGPVRLDLGAFRSAVAGKHAECLLVTAEASGDNRTFDVWGKLQQIPGFALDAAMSDASHVVVGIAASEDLLTAEMEWLLAQVRQQFGQAQVLPGISLDESLGGGLSVTLLLARQGERPVEHPVAAAPAAPSAPGPEWTENILPAANNGPRAPSRFVAPPPTVSPEKTRQIYRRQNPRGRRKTAGGEQVMLPLEVVSKGRFEKSDPTVRDGEDLDVPTYIRRGVLLN